MGACLGTKTPGENQQSNTYKKVKSTDINECSECSTKITNSECIALKDCTHVICTTCMGKFIGKFLKNIDKYPLQCPINDCHIHMDISDIKSVLNDNQMKTFHNLERFFNVPPKSRQCCPQCETWFKYAPKWHKTQSKPYQYIDDSERTQCNECSMPFTRGIAKRHRCRVCGEVLCDECSSTQIPLSATPAQIVSLWKQNRSSGEIEKGKKWIKGIAATSTLKNVFPEEQKTAKLQYSQSEKVQIESERVRSCYDCWMDYYCVQCKECRYKYCVKCRQQWHNDFDCESQLGTKVQFKLVEAGNDNAAYRQTSKSSGAKHVSSDEAKSSVNEALSKMEDRGEHLQLLEDKAQNMADKAAEFGQLAQQLDAKYS